MNACHSDADSPTGLQAGCTKDCAKDCTVDCSALQEKHNSYQAISTILNSLDALVYVSDLQTYDLIYLNDYGTKVWGQIGGRKCYQVLQAGQNAPCQFCTNHLLVDAAGKPTGTHVWEFQNTINGRWYQCRDQAVVWVDGRLVRIEIATDITERKVMEQQLAAAKSLAERQASTDELTQLYNRRAFFALGRHLFHQGRRAGQKHAVVMFDLDHFKRINDEWNHAAGDAVLVKISALARNLLRGSDVLARIGGEEFAILLPDTNEAEAWQLVERLRAGFELGTAHDEIHCTASFGITYVNLQDFPSELEPESLLGTLLHQADVAMMQAKATGRNRVCVFEQ